MIRELAKNLSNAGLDEVITALACNSNITITLNDSLVTPFIASAATTPFVFLTPSADSIQHAETVFRNCGLSVISVMRLPDMPIYTDASNSRDGELSSALNRFASGGIDVLILPAAALLCKVPHRQTQSIRLSVGDKHSVKQLTETLICFGYSRVQTIAEPGNFCARGDVMDIWQEGADNPHRIMFFGDQIEAVKSIDIQTYLSLEKLKNIEILPIAELTNISNDLIIKRLNELPKDNVNIAAATASLLERAQRGEQLGNVRWLLPFLTKFRTVLETLLDNTKRLVFDRPCEIEQAIKTAEQQNNLRFASLLESGLLLPKHSEMACSFSELPQQLGKFVCTAFQNISGKHRLFTSEKIIPLNTSPVPSYFSALSVLVPDIVRAVDTLGRTALVFVGGTKSCENYMSAKHVPYVISDINNFQAGKINLIRAELSLSFELTNCGLVIYSVEAQKNSLPTQNVFQRTAAAFSMPNIGDVVVHEIHGLGRFLGIKKLTLANAERDYIVLQYDGGAFVYLPPEQTGLLSNYSGEPTRLSRIGGQDFANAKQRVRRRLKELSFKLSELYARRAKIRANTYQIDAQTIAQFDVAFPYRLTPDQKNAIDDIEHDMLAHKVMDRLICGDVGYGKTEVAFRAAFRAIMAGFQVALLCPTTILSVQHYNSAKTRFESFGVRVEVLNRFKTDKECVAIIDCLRSGEIDFVIGTHKLLNNGIKYKNLGMLILDEEQRFGVGHKEAIKQLKSNIDVLTLSATPIPRTLNMALIGIRDISTILTPPVNRFPVVTYVCEYSDALIIDAINRERARGGQTIVLYNNVEHIIQFTARLQKLLGAARIGIIHGQLATHALEETIAALYNKEIDVLVASTIVENGIDISTANTLFAIDADRLGTAQMHQLRGRVGRSNIQAYAYFTYPHNKEISEISRARLNAIQNYASGGSGMQIAMRDLQLRGAGDLLGASQSGHMEQIGFDTYCKILAEVAAENRGETAGTEPIFETVLDISLNCFIPPEFIKNEEERMKIYVAVSSIKTKDDVQRILAELQDLYGRIPAEVQNIITVGYMRTLAKSKNIRHILFSDDECKITYSSGAKEYLEPNIANLLDFLEQKSNTKP